MRIKSRDLQAFVDAGLPEAPQTEPTPQEVEAWTAFGQAMARTTRKLKYKRSERDLVEVLRDLEKATGHLVAALQGESEEDGGNER